MTLTTKTIDNTCPCCSRDINAASSIDGDHRPEPGDVSICGYCGAILEFNTDLSLKVASTDTLREVPDEALTHLLRIQKLIEERLLASVH